MARPKGSKNKKTASTISNDIPENVESIDERITATLEAIKMLSVDLKAKKSELKQLARLKADAEAVAAARKAEEDKARILEAVTLSGKSVEEILEMLK